MTLTISQRALLIKLNRTRRKWLRWDELDSSQRRTATVLDKRPIARRLVNIYSGDMPLACLTDAGREALAATTK